MSPFEYTIDETDFIFSDISQQISDELELRGFTTNKPDGSKDLTKKIASIIKTYMEGNYNRGADITDDSILNDIAIQQAQMEAQVLFDEKYPPWMPSDFRDGDGDLENQGLPCDDEYPPTHPLEN